MYLLYSFGLLLALVFHLPMYFFRLKLSRGESLHLKERLGFRLPQKNENKESLWIHAVSVGEVLSLRNLINILNKRHPSWKIYFSSLTNSGIQIAREKIQEVNSIFFIPFDFACIVRKFFSAYRPRVLILTESEFWPNLLKEAKKQSCRILSINSRISSRSFKRYKRVRPLARALFKNIDLFLVQSEHDRERLEKIGINHDQMRISGNLKTEIDLPVFTERETSDLKKSLGIPESKKIIVAGSTRKGEEELLLGAYAKARNIRDDLLLIIAPRHPERCDEVEKISQGFSFRTGKRTAVKSNDQWDVLIIDTIGELTKFYALSDVAFVGGSLVPWGGHNLLEPAFYRKPIFFGPYMDNFLSLSEEFVRAQAARVAKNADDLVEMCQLKNETALEEMGRRAKEILNSFQGATEKTIKVIETLMADK